MGNRNVRLHLVDFFILEFDFSTDERCPFNFPLSIFLIPVGASCFTFTSNGGTTRYTLFLLLLLFSFDPQLSFESFYSAEDNRITYGFTTNLLQNTTEVLAALSTHFLARVTILQVMRNGDLHRQTSRDCCFPVAMDALLVMILTTPMSGVVYFSCLFGRHLPPKNAHIFVMLLVGRRILRRLALVLIFFRNFFSGFQAISLNPSSVNLAAFL